MGKTQVEKGAWKMNRKRESIISTFNRFAIVPLLCLGLSVLVITTFSIYTFMTAETEDGLKNLAHSLYETCHLVGKGEYTLKDGILMKGNEPFDSDYAIVDNIKKVSGIDATIFYKDARIITSILNEDGSRAIGTHPAPEVVQAVLQEGQEYFSQKVSVNGTLYFGYYIPLHNTDQSVIGMVFVGKARQGVIYAIERTILLIFLAIVVITAITLLVSLIYARRIVYSIQRTKEFLGSVAQGDIENTLDPYILKRKDELGEMGRFSIILQKSITELVGTDPLTGLSNRRSCGIIMANTMREYRKCKIPYVLVIGDIDSFKNINDKYGHLAGDVVLKELSAVFLNHMRHKGFVSRWGGEEFLFIYERMDKQRALSNLEELLTESSIL